jgi:DNA-directed RNA polymerase subunit RPC12/RpoP
VRHLPMLRRLEIYGVTQDYLVAEDLLAVRPDLDLGVFYLMYCASTGQNVETGENAVCRHDNPRQQEACFGPIRGRPIMSSLHHSRPGNMPLRVIFSCQHHMEEDISDPALYVCGVCEHYFEESGMYSEVVCKVCYDTRNLMHKARWTDLDHTHSIADFSFADIISRAMYITDRRNLPNTLTSYGSVNVVIDYKRQSAAVPEAKRLEVRPICYALIYIYICT